MISDRDRISTRQLNRLRRRILRVYGTARREMTEQLTEFLGKYRALDERKRAQLDAGEITEEDYRIWLQNQVFQSDLMRQKLDGITQTCTTAQQTAYKLARDEQYNIFSFGANWAFYELEQAAGVTFGLTLYNTEAVKLLLKENPKLVPNKRIKSESNRTYDARVFNRYVMQGIVQGKSVHDIAVQAVNGMADTEIHWAMNNAITALTGAQNAGALQQMRNAKALGIEVKKRWNSTHDYRTREMHRLLDQQTAAVQGHGLQDTAPRGPQRRAGDGLPLPLCAVLCAGQVPQAERRPAGKYRHIRRHGYGGRQRQAHKSGSKESRAGYDLYRVV